MSAVKTAVDALSAALAVVPGLRVYTDPGALIDPPGAVVGPPELVWEAYTTDPTSARFPVYVVVARDERALERLWDLVPVVAAALEEGVPDATTGRADPASYPTGTTELPAYLIPVDIALGG